MRIRLFSAALLAALCSAQPGLITTVIGTGVIAPGTSSPGGRVQLNNPTGVAVDSAGNIYVADRDNYVIRRLLVATDFMQTVAGCGLPTASCVDQTPGRLAGATLIFAPWDVQLDRTGSFYFSNSGRHRIQKVTNPGFILTDYAGSGPPGVSSSGFSGDGGPATSAKLSNPIGIAIDVAGNVYFSDRDNQ